MSIFPMTFPKCKVCGHEKTVGELAAKEDGLPAEAWDLGLDRKFTPLPRTNALATPVVKGVFYSMDICARCGTPRCIRAWTGQLGADDIAKALQTVAAGMAARKAA